MCGRAYIHTFIHTYIHTPVHTYIHTYTRTYQRVADKDLSFFDPPRTEIKRSRAHMVPANVKNTSFVLIAL